MGSINRSHRFPISKSDFKGSIGAVITFSATDEESFNNVPFWIEEVKKITHSNTRLVLVGTKYDCTYDTVVDYIRARDFADERQIPFF